MRRDFTEWEKYLDLNKAIQVQEDITVIITEAHIAAGQGEVPFTHGATVAVVTLDTPPETKR